ncbi:major facilitator superfamily domain-containing protein [Aspergillus egyptiacus]|nr:major facilitator superfamily domain-containing protein [Aspergillus egyptiacus]
MEPHSMPPCTRTVRLSNTAPAEKEAERGELTPVIAVNERKLMNKIDLRLLPLLCAMYMVTFLDRVNIGNAAVLGMREDLDMTTGTKYNAALLSFCVFGFGLVLVLQGLVESWGTLMVTRWFLGMFETGIFPGSVYLLSMWYRRSEAQKRYTFFANSSILAGAFGGLLASGIGKMDGVRGYGGWRWIFILEGCATCVMAVVVFFALPDFPEDCQWLDERELEFQRDRVSKETGPISSNVKIGWREVLAVFKDYKVFLGGFMLFGQVVGGYGYAFFAPTIIQSYGYGEIETQLYSIPPWAAAFVCSLTIACLSDYARNRYLFAILPMLISMAGFGILLSVHDTAHRHLQYGALFLLTSGASSASPVLLCWFGMNLGGHVRRSVGTAWQVGFGNLGGIVATYSFLAQDAPLYRTGYIIGLSFACFSAAMATLYFLAVWAENHQREEIMRDGTVEIAAEEEERLGDLACTYRYSY